MRFTNDFFSALRKRRLNETPVSLYILVLCLAGFRAQLLLHSSSLAHSGPRDTVAGQEISGIVTIIFDGDTIQVRLNDGSMEKVRLIGVDSPEMDDTREDVLFWAHMARRFAFHHLYRKKVTLSFDWERRDKYGRLLAYVRTLDGLFFNEFLIREGFAAALLAFPYEEKYQTLFKAAEGEARRQGRGMWKKGDSPVISDRDATRLAGQVLTVRFICESVQIRGDFAYLRSTESDFEALIPREKLALFPDWKSYESRALSVTGFLEIFKGTPQIMIIFPRQVEVHKYAAFLYCISDRKAKSRQGFHKTFKLDSRFDLTAGEASYPI